MKNKRLLLIALISIALTACSGSGNGGSTGTGTGTGTGNLSGTTGFRSLNATTPSNFTAQNNLNELVIGNQTITLIPTGFSAGTLFTTTGNLNLNGQVISQRAISGTNFSNSKFGVIQTPNGTDFTAFSQGNVTNVSNVPISGTATYNGFFATRAASNLFTGNVITDVNFGAAKSVTVNLNDAANRSGTSATLGNRSFNASISGNSFSSANNQAKGAFYGANAEELGGIYNENNASTAFGAKK